MTFTREGKFVTAHNIVSTRKQDEYIVVTIFIDGRKMDFVFELTKAGNLIRKERTDPDLHWPSFVWSRAIKSK
jgi:hypothetical protein